MRIIIRPVVDRQNEIDVTSRLIAAIAEELWRLYGGNEQLNWLEAELHLQRIVGETQAQARDAEVATIAAGGPASSEDTSVTQLEPGPAAATADLLLRDDRAVSGSGGRAVPAKRRPRSTGAARRRVAVAK